MLQHISHESIFLCRSRLHDFWQKKERGVSCSKCKMRFFRKRSVGMEILQEYLVPCVMALCFCAGYIIKKWVKDVDNKWIPTICAILGVLLNIWVAKEFSPPVLLGGMASGLAATGLDQLVRTNENKGVG